MAKVAAAVTDPSATISAEMSESELAGARRSPTATTPPVASFQRTTRREWAIVLAACASPLLLLLGSRDWLLTPATNIDPWMYVAFFDHYANPGYLAGQYKLARLPWILSGWLVHRVVPGVMGAYVLHAIFLIAGGCGFFLLLRALFGRFRLALLGAMLLVFHPPFHGSGGWDYHNTAAGPIYIWALAIVTLTAIHGGVQYALLAGVLAALAVHSNITYGVFLPVLAIHYLFVCKSVGGRFPSWRVVATTAMWAGIGAVGVTALLSAINVMVGREALFFATLLSITLRYTRDTTYLAGWWSPWRSGWYWSSTHLALPTVMVLLSAVLLIVSRYSKPVARLRERLVAIEFLVMAAVWTAWQFAGNLTLQWNYFMFPLQPHVLLALMALANARLTTIPVWALLGTPLLLLLSLSVGLTHYLYPLLSTSLPGALLGPAACFLVGGVAMWTPSAFRALAFAGFFAIGNALLANESYAAQGACHDGAEVYSAIVAANLFVAAADPDLVKTRLWFDETEGTATRENCPLAIAQIGYSLAGTGVPYLVNPFPMPAPAKIPDEILRFMGTSKLKMAIVSIAPGSVTAFKRRALEAGVDAVPEASRWFAARDARFEVTLLRLQQSREPALRIMQLPGAVIGDWNREILASLLGVNTYAVPRQQVLQRGAGGEWLFVPATPGDHLATAFVPVPASPDERALLVAAAPGATRDVNCTVFIQDQRLRVIGTAGCGEPSTSMDDTIVRLSPDVTSVRVFFQSPTQNTMVLPNRLRITYHHGAGAR